MDSMETYAGSSSIGTGSTGKDKNDKNDKNGSKRKMGSMMGGVISRHEDPMTSAIEKTTAKVPSTAFLALALGAMIGSLGAFFAGRRDGALLMATWVPTILILGNYNKIVKALENVGEGGMGRQFLGGSKAF